ncbi:hypothetical protein Aca07nite_36690 [Actinoplanes capillaceus]|uniref:Hemolysin-type calcium-binding repeat-containing protein n=1 Tax=Actinoplanes campanulatus TaxID=113559 RepID=A0ABQ3WJI5_9ACTN|nr:calcium-binding protein [Actinoplanes capillaceus]GID46394.1 hypothetical protein Aca07nite_36690 [Actinoplanes capillaceus]
MYLPNRKLLAMIGATAAAVGSTALLAAPAQAAAVGSAKVDTYGVVSFAASTGKTNGLTITVSGQTVTLDDLVTIKAGAGCAAVAGDKTKVTCTATKISSLSVNLGDKNDWVKNKTGLGISIDGGAGNDTLVGGSANDRIVGGSGNDKIYGGAGGEVIYGNSGNDIVYGGAGTDNVSGGTGNDKIYGQDGDDQVYGGSGTDLINGAAGRDRLHGGAGADKIYAGAGTGTATEFGDQVWGDSGNDTIYGEAGDDEIYAGSGNDTVDAGSSDDIVLGQSGNDTINGGSGDDALAGESIDDKFKAIGSSKAKDKLTGGSGVDLCLVLKSGKASCEYKSFQDYIGNLSASRAAVIGRLG